MHKADQNACGCGMLYNDSCRFVHITLLSFYYSMSRKRGRDERLMAQDPAFIMQIQESLIWLLK